MATVGRTLVFATTLESFAEVGDHAQIALALDTAGNPAKSLEFTGNPTSAGIERARLAGTWESIFGVPSGSTVTDAQVTGADLNKWAGVTGSRLKIRIVDSGFATVHAAGELLDRDVNAQTTGIWTAGGGASRAIDSGSQASATTISIEIEQSWSGTSGALDTGVDNVVFLVTYTTGGGSTVTFAATPAGTGAITVSVALQKALGVALAGQGTIVVAAALQRALAAAITGDTALTVALVRQLGLEAALGGTATITTDLDNGTGGTVAKLRALLGVGE